MKNCLLPGIKPSVAHVKSAIEVPLWLVHLKHSFDKLSTVKHYFFIDLPRQVSKYVGTSLKTSNKSLILRNLFLEKVFALKKAESKVNQEREMKGKHKHKHDV